MRSDIFGLGLRRVWTWIAISLLIGCLTACDRKVGGAIVLEKEHIAVVEIPATPNGSPAAPPAPAEEEVKPFELGADEITVDSYVMKKEFRGTSKDPRATNHEQWLIKVELVTGGRRINVQADRAQYEKLEVGESSAGEISGREIHSYGLGARRLSKSHRRNKRVL